MQIEYWKEIIKKRSNGILELVRLFWDKDKGVRYAYLKCEIHGEYEYRLNAVKDVKTLMCPKCREEAKLKNYSLKKIKGIVKNIKPEYLVKDKRLSSYGELDILVSCGKHDFYWANGNYFLNINTTCKFCSHENRANNMAEGYNPEYSQLTSEILKERGLTIISSENYKNTRSYIDLQDEYGYKYKNTISSLKQHVPFKFRKNNPYTIENIKLWVSLNRPDYELISTKYINAKSKLEFKYIGSFLGENISPIFKATFDHFYHGKVRHPSLTKTKMEEIAESFLIENNVNFIPQYIEHSCINPKTNCGLRFDIALLNENDEVYKIIELDGESHTQAVDIWGGEEGLKETIYRDSIKDKYCLDNDIQMIRISYLDSDNIPEILTKILLKEAI